MELSQQIHTDQKLKRLFNSSPVFKQYASGSYSPESFIDEFGLILTDSDKNFLRSLPGIKIITDMAYQKTATIAE